MSCASWVAVKPQPYGEKAVPLRCKRWSCEECGPMRQQQLKAIARKGEPDTFITLTCRPRDGETPHERAQLLSWAWKAVRRRARKEAKRDLRRKPTPEGPVPASGWQLDTGGCVPRQVRLTSEQIEFVAVFEKTKLGEPHLHILCRAAWLDQKWLSAQMHELIDAPVVYVTRVTDPRKVAYYVAKYIAKEPCKFDGVKRYWWTKGYKLSDEPHTREEAEQQGWRVYQQSIDLYFADAAVRGLMFIGWDGSAAVMVDFSKGGARSGAPPPPAKLQLC